MTQSPIFLYKNERDPQNSPAALHRQEFPITGGDRQRPGDNLPGLQQWVLARGLLEEVISHGAPVGPQSLREAGIFAFAELIVQGSNFQPSLGRHTGVLQELLKHAIPDYLVQGTDLFFLGLSN